MDFLVRAFARFKGKQCQLVIAGGGGADLDRLKDLSCQLGVESQVNFLGRVADDFLPSLYAHALSFVYPSLYEGFGLQLVEAMKMGCPVISSRASSLPEVLGFEEALFDPHNEDELVEKMGQMLVNEEFRQQVKDHCLTRKNDFSWQKTAQETLKIYQSM